MAWKIPKFKFNFNFFSALDARTRIFVLIAGVVLMVVLVYVVTRFFSGGVGATGPTTVAGAPNLQSVPGTQLTPEYYRALTQAQQQAAQQAQVTAGSAVPTLINPGGETTAGCVICTPQAASVKNLIDKWVKEGSISPDIASQLQQLADQNVPVATYAQKLQDLVKQGKLTPEQARQLLDEYQRQHANERINTGAKAMDSLISSGKLPLDVANQLLSAQRDNISPCAYEAELQRFVTTGKISQQTASYLASQYSQQTIIEITQLTIGKLQAMVRSGEMTEDVERQLESLVKQMVPLDTFSNTVQSLVTQGKMVPVAATKVTDTYRQAKNQIGGSVLMSQLQQSAKNNMTQEIMYLVNQKKMTTDIASGIAGLMQRDVSLQAFSAPINQFVKEGKLTQDIAALKIADYQKITGLASMADRLVNLKANNASSADLATELKADVQAGLITPEQATQLSTECVIQVAAPAAGITPVTGDQAFAQLQQRAQAAPTAPPVGVTPAEFATAKTQATEAAGQQRDQRISGMVEAMRSQAGDLIGSWAAPTMQHFGHSAAETAATTTPPTAATTPTAGATTTTTTTTTPTGPVLIRAGTVLYAVLDTAVNSDYKTSPVMATVVLGPLKGAKLLGQLVTAQNPAGVLDRIGLNFTLMNSDQWPDSKTVTAYAIDPDTARSVFASNVNYHYLVRYGAIFASSFLQGFASAISNSGSTQTTGVFGTSTQHIVTSTSQNIWIGLGQVGTTIGSAVANYANIPPTVYVNAGVSLGILFMADVT